MADVVRVSIKGTMPSGEAWSINPVYRCFSGSVISSGELIAAAAGINGITIPANLLQMLATSCAVTGVQLEARTLGGELEAQAEALRSAPVVGTGTGALPFQSALVLSLRTAGGGANGRGRLYWPATGVVLTPATLRINTAAWNNFLADMKVYLTAIQTALNASIDETLSLAVWSRSTASAADVGILRVGDVVDTQRRRRDAVPESYKDVTYF